MDRRIPNYDSGDKEEKGDLVLKDGKWIIEPRRIPSRMVRDRIEAEDALKSK